jgi:general secretion pathway protein K
LLSALLSDFAFSTLVDMRLTETFRDTTKAEYLARGGITAGRMILQTDRNKYDARDDMSELWSIGVQDYPLAEGTVSVKIEDLDGRLPLNNLVGGILYSEFRNRFERLCTELALDNPAALADALIDWIDPDDTPLAGGAEDAYYRSLSPPYEATDGPLRSIDELLLIRGFDAETVARLRPFVNTVADSDGKLNINTAAPELLLIWDIDMTNAIVEDLQAWQEKNTFKDPGTLSADLIDAIGPNLVSVINRNGDLKVTSSYYQITSLGRVNDGSRRMTAIVKKTDDKLLWQKVN